MGYFYINAITAYSATITVVPDTAYPIYRVFVRTGTYDGGGSAVFDQYYPMTGTGVITATVSLSPGTTYTANVSYCDASLNGQGWYGAQQFNTPNDTTIYEATVYYNANGGVGGPYSDSGRNTASTIWITLTSAFPTRDGYTFLGWSSSPYATTPEFYGGSSYMFSAGSHTLYAVWSGGGGGGTDPPPITPGTEGGCRVWTGSQWVQATPYIWTGSQWVQATPYIWTGSQWVQTS